MGRAKSNPNYMNGVPEDLVKDPIVRKAYLGEDFKL